MFRKAFGWHRKGTVPIALDLDERDPSNAARASFAHASGQTGSYVVESISNGCAVWVPLRGTKLCVLGMAHCCLA